jgi:hypothetical protein
VGQGVLLRFLYVLHREREQVLARSTFDGAADCVLWDGKAGGREGGRGRMCEASCSVRSPAG